MAESSLPPEFNDESFAGYTQMMAQRFRVFVPLEVALFSLSALFIIATVPTLFLWPLLALAFASAFFLFFALFLFLILTRIVSYINGVRMVFALLASQNRIIVGLFRTASAPPQPHRAM